MKIAITGKLSRNRFVLAEELAAIGIEVMDKVVEDTKFLIVGTFDKPTTTAKMAAAAEYKIPMMVEEEFWENVVGNIELELAR